MPLARYLHVPVRITERHKRAAGTASLKQARSLLLTNAWRRCNAFKARAAGRKYGMSTQSIHHSHGMLTVGSSDPSMGRRADHSQLLRCL